MKKSLKFLNKPYMAQIYNIYFNNQNLCDFNLPFISGIFEKSINKRTFRTKYVSWIALVKK